MLQSDPTRTSEYFAYLPIGSDINLDMLAIWALVEKNLGLLMEGTGGYRK